MYERVVAVTGHLLLDTFIQNYDQLPWMLIAGTWRSRAILDDCASGFFRTSEVFFFALMRKKVYKQHLREDAALRRGAGFVLVGNNNFQYVDISS